MPACDPYVYENGTSVGWISGKAAFVEEYVKAIAVLAGQPVDWHYIGGRANVLTIGSVEKVKAIIRASPPKDEAWKLWD